MKKILLFITCTVFLLTAFTTKKKEFIPPGTVKINDTLYADEVEITNKAWQEYEIWTKNKFGLNSKEYFSVLPDTTVWREKECTNEPYVQYYYRHPAYQEYPLVGVSFEQVIEFCKWRTERVRDSAGKKYSTANFEYRLPSKKEWEFLSSDCIDVLNNGGRNKKGQVAFNHRWAKNNEEWMADKQRTGANESNEVFAPAFSYWPNSMKLYNMLGNVAEMVSEKGISKGGSWQNLLEECRVEKDIPYSKPTAMLGFRCVCVVKRTKL